MERASSNLKISLALILFPLAFLLSGCSATITGYAASSVDDSMDEIRCAIDVEIAVVEIDNEYQICKEDDRLSVVIENLGAEVSGLQIIFDDDPQRIVNTFTGIPEGGAINEEVDAGSEFSDALIIPKITSKGRSRLCFENALDFRSVQHCSLK